MQSLKDSFEAVKLTLTVTYNNHYTHSNGEPVCITFDIGATVSVNAIIGLPTLTSREPSNHTSSIIIRIPIIISLMKTNQYQPGYHQHPCC